MRVVAVNRRRFLVAAVTFLGAQTGTFGIQLGRVWAQGNADVAKGTRDMMVRVARRLYPHDAISDDVYAAALDAALTATAADASFAETLRQAEIALGAHGVGFMQLDEAGQVAALRAIERTEVFGAIQAAVRSRFYNHPTVWKHIGYGGPSFAEGGYLHRGAGEVDWLEEAQ
jgi:hypothetical protein